MKSGIQEPPLEKFIPKRNRLFDEFVRDLDHLSTIYNFNMNFIAYQNLIVLYCRDVRFFSVKFESEKLSFITGSGGSTIGRGGATGGNSIDALAAAKNKKPLVVSKITIKVHFPYLKNQPVKFNL